jgi:hypothetical protein
VLQERDVENTHSKDFSCLSVVLFHRTREEKDKKKKKKEFLSYQRTRVRRLILMMMTRLLLLVEVALQGVDNHAGLYLHTAENKFKSELSSQSRTS